MKTAVEWLYEILHKQNYIYEDMSEYLKQAKEMEKQQIIDAYLKNRPKATIDKALILWDDAEQYYNETFKIE